VVFRTLLRNFMQASLLYQVFVHMDIEICGGLDNWEYLRNPRRFNPSFVFHVDQLMQVHHPPRRSRLGVRGEGLGLHAYQIR